MKSNNVAGAYHAQQAENHKQMPQHLQGMNRSKI
jgi:hypothetical protein